MSLCNFVPTELVLIRTSCAACKINEARAGQCSPRCQWQCLNGAIIGTFPSKNCKPLRKTGEVIDILNRRGLARCEMVQ